MRKGSDLVKIIYLHGLGSGGQSSTAQGLSALGFDVVSPSYRPEHYKESMAMLHGLMLETEPSVIVGTSMGGYYALKLREQLSLPTVSINPCYAPEQLLVKYLDEPAFDFVANKPIEFTQAMLDEFEPIDRNDNTHPNGLTVLVGAKDDVIPAEAQQHFLSERQWQWQTVDWGHRVDDVKLLATIILAH